MQFQFGRGGFQAFFNLFDVFVCRDIFRQDTANAADGVAYFTPDLLFVDLDGL